MGSPIESSEISRQANSLKSEPRASAKFYSDIDLIGKNIESKAANDRAQFYGKDGKKIDIKSHPNDGVVYSIEINGDEVRTSYYSTAKAARKGEKPFQAGSFTSGKDGYFTWEEHKLFDGVPGRGGKILESLLIASDDHTGAISSRYVAGNYKEHAEFDANGAVKQFETNDGIEHYRCLFRANAPIQITKDGREVSLDGARDFLAKSKEAIARIRLEGLIAEPPADHWAELRTTELISHFAGEPNGAFVWREGDVLRRAKVIDGIIKGDKNQSVGTIDSTGVGKLLANAAAGRPTTVWFDIRNTSEDMSFHGASTDGIRLDFVSSKARAGFTGVLTSHSAPGKMSVIEGNIYDQGGNFKGRLGSNGRVETIIAGHSNEVQAINSFISGWTFEGEFEGKPRVFGISHDTCNGKIFIPDKPGALPVQHTVQMGMVIGPNGEQTGWVVPPKRHKGGQLSGGTLALVTKNGIQEKPLASYENVVFELKPLGEMGSEVESISGVCRGTDTYADGSLKPGQGYFNLGYAASRQDKIIESAKNRRSELINNFDPIYLIGANNFAIAREDSKIREAQKNAALYQQPLENGQFDISQLQKIATHTEIALAGSQRSWWRKELDRQPHQLEELPLKTNEITGGWVSLVQPDGSSVKLDIYQGKLFDKQGKQIGSFLPKEGQIIVNGTAIAMGDLTGTIWHLNIKNRLLDWASGGPELGIISKLDLQNRAVAELNYAAAQSRDSSSNGPAYKETQTKHAAFLARIDKIFDSGSASAADVAYLAEGPAKHVRSEQYAFKPVEKPLERIEVPALNTENDCRRVNGLLRIGNDIYEINSGDLRLFDSTAELAPPDPGARVPDGKLLPGYRIALEGGGIVELANENRVMMKFNLAKSAYPDQGLINMLSPTGKDRALSQETEGSYQILGAGPSRFVSGQGFVSGGLVNAQQLINTATQAVEASGRSTAEYVRSQTLVTGEGTDILMSGLEDGLISLNTNSQLNRKLLCQEVRQLFDTGFSRAKCSNNDIDRRVRLFQSLLHNTEQTAADADLLAKKGEKVQQLVVDSSVTAAIVGTTAVLGPVGGALGKTAQIVRMGRWGTMLVLGAEVGASAIAGGAISTVFRYSKDSSVSENFLAGAGEAIRNTLFATGGRWLGTGFKIREAQEILKLQKLGRALNPEQLAFLAEVKGTAAGYLLDRGYSTAAVASARHAFRGVNAMSHALGSESEAEGQSFQSRALTDYLAQLAARRLSRGLVNGKIIGDLTHRASRIAFRETAEKVNANSFNNVDFPMPKLEAIGPLADFQNLEIIIPDK